MAHRGLTEQTRLLTQGVAVLPDRASSPEFSRALGSLLSRAAQGSMCNLPHTLSQCAASLPYANNCAASWPWTAQSACSLGFLGPAPQDGPHCTASQPYTAWPRQDPALHWLRVIDSIFALSPVLHLHPAAVLPLLSLQPSSVRCYSLGPHCCIGLVDSLRSWAWLLAMHHCAVPTDGMPPQHCISASRGMSACSWPSLSHCATAL